MASGVVRVDGARELRASLSKLGAEVEDFKEVHGKVASYVGARAAGKAPRRSGMLAASWRPGAQKANATVRFGGAAIPYANAVHWGTGPRPGQRGPHNIPRRPFAVDAAHETEPTWVDWYLAELNRMLSKVKGA